MTRLHGHKNWDPAMCKKRLKISLKKQKESGISQMQCEISKSRISQSLNHVQCQTAEWIFLMIWSLWNRQQRQYFVKCEKVAVFDQSAKFHDFKFTTTNIFIEKCPFNFHLWMKKPTFFRNPTKFSENFSHPYTLHSALSPGVKNGRSL